MGKVHLAFKRTSKHFQNTSVSSRVCRGGHNLPQIWPYLSASA